MEKSYDYIFAGLGASGFSLLLRLLKIPDFKDKKVLLLDTDLKDKNDRTWCFWEKELGFFEEIVSYSWDQLFFYSPKRTKSLNISPYKYKMIKGKEFYSYCWNEVKKHPNVTFIQDEIQSLKGNEVTCKNATYSADLIFNSAIRNFQSGKNDHNLLQHFKGYVIETKDDVFDVDKPILMDFRVHQNYGCTFVYTMPFTSRTALVEYTLFSKELLEKEKYDEELNHYLREFTGIKDYNVLETEFGVIPMTTAKLKPYTSKHIINIGTAGGQTKASTGYTFTNIQQRSDLIAQNLRQGKKPLNGLKNTVKHDYFDAVLLNIMDENKYPIWKAFDDMFNKLPAPLVLDFLDNKTKLLEDLRIMASVHTPTFLKSAIKKMVY